LFNDLNRKLKVENEQLQQENTKISAERDALQLKCDQTTNEMNVYLRALELKTEEFQKVAAAMGIDIKASLL